MIDDCESVSVDRHLDDESQLFFAAELCSSLKFPFELLNLFFLYNPISITPLLSNNPFKIKFPVLI